MSRSNRNAASNTPDFRRKIVDADRLQQIIANLRQPGASGEKPPRIVQCHGCFDIVHPGHIRYLQFARTQGDLLIVSITGDAAIDKGNQRPYIPQELRAENLAALEFVDYVVIDPHRDACSLLGRVKPDVYVKGAEYAASRDPRFLAEREVVESCGGRVIFSSGQVVFSSSRLIESLEPDASLGTRRLAAVCRRHGVDVAALEGVLDGIARKRVIIAGDSLVERYVICDATQVADESPMMSLKELACRDYPGGAALVALLAAGLGAEVQLVTAIGSDRSSAWLLEALHDADVDVRAVRHRPEMALRTRYLADDKKLLRVNRTPVHPLDSVGEREAAEILLGQAVKTDVAILYDCGLGMLTPGLVQRMGATFRRRLPIMAVGAAESEGDLKLGKHADLLCATERQMRAAADEAAAGLSTVAYKLLQSTHAKRMIALLGKRGLVTFDRPSHDPESPGWNERLHSEFLPDLSTRCLDELGVAETVLAAGALALSAGASLMQSAYLGIAGAALQRATLGPAVVAADTLRRWIADRPELEWDGAEPDEEILPDDLFPEFIAHAHQQPVES